MSSKYDMLYWRKKICDTLLLMFSIFGLFTYIPSMILALREGVYGVVAIASVVYFTCIFLTFNKKIDYLKRTVSLSVLYYIAGIFLIFLLGMSGAGEVWLFSSTFLIALILGNPGAIATLIANTVVLGIIYILLYSGIMSWEHYGITREIWFVKSINFIILNFSLVVANAVFVKGFNTVVSRSQETRDASIIGLAKLAEYRDNDTGNHLHRIRTIVELLAGDLSKHPEYSQYVTRDYIRDLSISSILHDIGKVGIQDAILLKPGSLSDEEFALIKQHPEIGGSVISEIEKNIDGRSLYSLGKEIALHHHEKWDGSGYPAGLKGKAIPLSARIIAIADVYDALVSERPYKKRMPHEQAIAIIKENSGSHFDPDLVEAFLRIAPGVETASELSNN